MLTMMIIAGLPKCDGQYSKIEAFFAILDSFLGRVERF